MSKHILLTCGAPNDEFDSYSLKIAEIITENNTVEDIAMLIAEIIDNAFDEEVKPEKFLKISKKIKNALKEVNK